MHILFYPPYLDLSNLNTVIRGMNSEAVYDIFTGIISDQTNSSSITALKNETSFEFTLIPTVLTTAHKIDFNINGSTYTWNLSEDIEELQGGNKYIYDITLSPDFTPIKIEGNIKAWIDNEGSVNVKPKEDIPFQIGDYFPDPTLNPNIPEEKARIQGIVFEVTNAGKNGKVLSMLETNSIIWGPNAKVETYEEDNGMLNLNLIKEIDPDLNLYPPFKWANDLGDGWYIPAKNEVIAIRDFWQADRDGINDKFTDAGGMALYRASGTNYYISSTEDRSASNKIWSVGFANKNNVNTAIKANTASSATLVFRAVKQF